MPKVKVGDINMYYEVHGEGEPLVLIPGATGNVDTSSAHIQAFSAEYRVIAYDPRGAGQSDAPEIPYTMEMMADDLAGLLDAINIDSAHLHGESLGGMIAQEFVLRHPDRVRNLVLACTNPGIAHRVRTDEETRSTIERLRSLPPEDRITGMFRLNVSQKFLDNNPDSIQTFIEITQKHPAPPQGQMGQTQAVASHDTYDRLPEIKAPTLVIHGEIDRMVPVENARILASRIPGAELVILKGMGHLFNVEAEDESNKIILDFLRRHPASKA